MADRHERRAFLELVRLALPVAVCVIAAFVVAYQFVDPAPPTRITLATGTPGGAYAAFGERYREILARSGVTLELRTSAGSVENLELLTRARDPVDVAFVQGGLTDHALGAPLMSLASLYYEPMWVFHRSGLQLEHLSDLAGARIAVGPEGSGSRAVALTVLASNDIDADGFTASPLAGHEAAELIAAGELDAAIVVGSPFAESVSVPLETPGVALLDLERAPAYARQHRFVTDVVLHEGVLDLGENLPDRDIELVATTANLVAREELHPALVDLLLAAADEIHRPGGLLEEPGEFPSPGLSDFPLSDDARRFFDSGPPFLRRALPYWAATLVDRLLVMLLPLVAVAIPMFRLMPALYRWRMRSRIYRWYKRLRPLEERIRDAAGAPDEAAVELEAISREVEQLSVPWSFADELYQLRLHIDMVRGRLEAASRATSND